MRMIEPITRVPEEWCSRYPCLLKATVNSGEDFDYYAGWAMERPPSGKAGIIEGRSRIYYSNNLNTTKYEKYRLITLAHEAGHIVTDYDVDKYGDISLDMLIFKEKEADEIAIELIGKEKVIDWLHHIKRWFPNSYDITLLRIRHARSYHRKTQD